LRRKRKKEEEEEDQEKSATPPKSERKMKNEQRFASFSLVFFLGVLSFFSFALFGQKGERESFRERYFTPSRERSSLLTCISLL